MVDILYHYSNSTDKYYVVIDRKEYNITEYTKRMIQRSRYKREKELEKAFNKLLGNEYSWSEIINEADKDNED